MEMNFNKNGILQVYLPGKHDLKTVSSFVVVLQRTSEKCVKTPTARAKLCRVLPIKVFVAIQDVAIIRFKSVGTFQNLSASATRAQLDP